MWACEFIWVGRDAIIKNIKLTNFVGEMMSSAWGHFDESGYPSETS